MVATLAVACCAACSAYGSSVLILPEAPLDATIAVVGTHAAVWTTR
jgi:hypothetical protein